MKAFFDRLFGRKPEPAPGPGDLVMVPSTATDGRAEAAMPGTSALEPILTLEAPPAPPMDPTLAEERDHGPDPGSEWSVRWDAAAPFDAEQLRSVLTRPVREGFARPTFYAVTPAGRTTYLTSSEAPAEAVALIAGWSFWNDPDVDAIFAGAQALDAWLAEHPAGFARAALDRSDLDAAEARADAVKAVRPEDIVFEVHAGGAWMDGKAVWNTMHAMGFRWGDMDCFQIGRAHV